MTTTAAVDEPLAAVDRFLRALARGDVEKLSSQLCRDACFLTQDATAIHGRARVGALLGQLVNANLRVLSERCHAIPMGDFALVCARWEMRLSTHAGPLSQTTDATLALARRESRWKLLLIAPWGWP